MVMYNVNTHNINNPPPPPPRYPPRRYRRRHPITAVLTTYAFSYFLIDDTLTCMVEPNQYHHLEVPDDAGNYTALDEMHVVGASTRGFYL